MPRLTPVRPHTLVRVFEADGWTLDRTRGSHILLTKPGAARPLVIPRHDEVAVFVVAGLLKTARMSRKRYFELLARAGG